MNSAESKLIFSTKLPRVESFGPHAFLIHDRRLSQLIPGFREWATRFPASYGVTSGEGLKDVRAFAKHIERVVHLTRNLSPRGMKMVVAGGGSVGDFGGFVASVFKRGVELVHVPTTWLAAIDSAHGGKTALNALGIKNQIGTFYPASEVHLVKRVLLAQPERRALEASGELAKIALIDGRPWTRRLAAQASPRKVSRGELIWDCLSDAIEAKLRVVRRDPEERSGERQILNLGHTLGHVLEVTMDISHGEAVAQGLHFALEWSRKRRLLGGRDYRRARSYLVGQLGLTPFIESPGARLMRKRPSIKLATRILLNDKKRESVGQVTFIFLERVGRPVRLPVSIAELVTEAREQGWIK